MIKHQNRIVCLLGIVFGIFLSVGYVNPYTGEIKLSELVLQLSGSRGEFALGFSATELLAFSMRMLPGWMIEAYLGIALYRHFCTASIYVFSRCPNRGKWYWKEMLVIGCNVFFFQIILLASTIVTTMFRYQIQVDDGGIGVILYHVLIQFAWIYSATILINILALKAGSNLAFIVVMMVQTTGIAIVSFLGSMSAYLESHIAVTNLLVKLNPVSHLILGWHSSCFQKIDNVLNSTVYQVLIPVCETFYLEVSLFVMVCINICILLIGLIVIKKHDLLISDAEMGVA